MPAASEEFSPVIDFTNNKVSGEEELVAESQPLGDANFEQN